MKKTILYISLFIITVAFAGCKEEFVGQTPVDKIPPGVITNVQVQNIPGGAVITYQIPDDDDLCFVRAEYVRKGEPCTDHASVYKNSLKIEGLGATDPVEITIYAVDFSMNKSRPVKVTIQPEPLYIHGIFGSIEPMEDFAGVNIQWENDNEQDISITLLYKEDGAFIEKGACFSNSKKGEYIFRTFESIPTEFKVFVKDQWENSSDTLDFELTPLYEVAIDRTLYREMRLPFDNTSAAWGAWWALWDNCHDGDVFDLGWVTEVNNNPQNDYRFPIMTTFDLGTTAKLSRTRMWMRGLLEYGTGAFRKIEFWGSETLDTNKPNNYWASDERGSWKNDWIFLGEFETTKPSGPSNTVVTEEDKIFARDGFEFKFNLVPKVRYVRLLVNSTWSGARNLELCEIAYWGNDKNE